MKHMLLCLSALLVCAIVFALPRIPQDPAYHVMADHRPLGSLPNALDVLSNLPFAFAGVAGLVTVMRRRPADSAWAVADRHGRWAWATFFTAAIATTFGSIYYHLAPDNDRVLWDRLPIAIAFAGLMTAVVAERVSARAGRALLVPLMLAAIGSVLFWYWSESYGQGDLRPYICVQFGSLIILLVILALYREPRGDGRFLVAGLALYGVAKLCELADRPIYDVLHLVSGHTLKHIAAAAGVACALAMLRARVSQTGRRPELHPLVPASLVEQRLRCYCDPMTLKARVKAGRLVVDEPTDLPREPRSSSCRLIPGTGSMRRIGRRSIRPSRIPTKTSRPVVSSTRT